MYLKLLKGSLFRRLSSTILIIITVWVGMTLMVSFLTVMISVGDKLKIELASLGANIYVEPKEASISKSFSDFWPEQNSSPNYLEEKEVLKLKSTLFWRNNILGLSPHLWGKVSFKSTNISILGVWIHKAIPLENGEIFYSGADDLYQHWKIQGKWPKIAQKECLIGIDLAKKWKLKIGQSILCSLQKEKTTWKIVGILSSGTKIDQVIVSSLGEVQKFLKLPGKISSLEVNALTTPEQKLAIKYQKNPTSLTPEEYERWSCTPFPGSVAVQIQNQIPNSTAQVLRRISQTQGVMLNQLEGLMVILGSLTFVVVCLSIMGVLTLTIMERKMEVALLQALGAKRGELLLFFFSESLILGLIGGILASGSGYFLGAWLVKEVFATSISGFPMAILLVSPFIGMIVVSVSTSWSIWQIFSINPSTLLHR